MGRSWFIVGRIEIILASVEKTSSAAQRGCLSALCLVFALAGSVHSQSLSISTLAGSGSRGSQDAAALSAQFSDPCGVAVDNAGNVYVADTYNSVLRRITAGTGGTNWVTSTLAGLAPSTGNVNGTNAFARFDGPTALALDSSNNIYVADSGNHSIRRVACDATGTNWIVTTLAGSGSFGAVNGTNTAAQFNYPTGLAVDGAGNIYVADKNNSAIRLISPDATGANWIVSTYAGKLKTSGNVDGAAAAARFSSPNSVALDAATNLYVADGFNYTVRMITPAGVVSTLAGSFGSANGTGTNAQFNFPCGLAVDGATNIYVSDFFNSTIRRLTRTGSSWSSVTLAGQAGFIGSSDAVGSFARFDFENTPINPNGVAVDGAGNVYIADSENLKIRLGVPFEGLLVTNTPIAVTGFNRDLVVENTAAGNGGIYDTSLYAQAFDLVNPTYAFYETNLNAISWSGGEGHTLGLPQSGTVTSLLDGTTVFQLAPYTGNNALFLTSNSSSGTLTLFSPAVYDVLNILAVSANGGGAGSCIIEFANGGVSAPLSYIANDWYNDPGAAAITHFGRIFYGAYTGGFYTEDDSGNDPNLYQTTLNLAALGLNTQPITAVEFFIPSGSGTSANTTTAIFALSGTSALLLPTPHPVAGNFIFSFQTTSGQSYTIEQCANLALGVWQACAHVTGNGQAYPVTVPLTNSQQFFRVSQP
jgi:sugar lactone lactonase YvrE